MTTALETRYAGHRFRSRLGETPRAMTAAVVDALTGGEQP